MTAMTGNLIGENRAELAWRVYRFLVKVALVLYGLVAVFLLIFQNQYAYLMSDDEGVQDLLIQTVPIVALFSFMQCMFRFIQSPLMAVSL